jgi:clan AA aspartic protease
MPIHGTVTSAREPVIVLETLPTRRKISLIIDTGFSGELCLPLRMIKSLGFQQYGREPFVLADGRIVRANVYKGQVRWFNKRQPVEVIALDNPRGLLGTQILQR